MTRVLISADMEGATGVTCPADVIAGTPQFERFRRMLTGDVNAAIAGFIEGGATDVLVNEAHCDMRNVLLEELDARASMLTGRHKWLSMMEGVKDVDVVAFIGYHTGSGQPGVLAHTYLADAITGVWINGEPATEGRMNALLAKEYGVPVVLVTGDDLTCEDANSYAPEAKTVAVKTAVARYSAICRPPEVTARQIQDTAASAVREIAAEAALREKLEPGSLPYEKNQTTQQIHELAHQGHGGASEYVYEVEFDSVYLPIAVETIPTVDISGERRVTWSAPTMHDAIRCFKVVTTMANAAREPSWT